MNLSKYLAESKSTNTLFRITINATARTQMSDFYSALSIAAQYDDCVLWDIAKLKTEPATAAGVSTAEP